MNRKQTIAAKNNKNNADADEQELREKKKELR